MENIPQHSSSCVHHRSEQKQCWICLETDVDDGDYEFVRYWVSPCKCHGSIRWVHQHCVQRWIDEKLIEYRNIKVQCPQCQTEYIITYDEVNYLVRLLNLLDNTANRICPVLVIVFGSSLLYWTAVSYGVMTMIQVMGKIEAMTMMENTDLLLLIFVLPTIPLSLILSKTINWEETLILSVRRFTSKQHLLRTIMPSFLCEPINSSTNLVQFHSVENLKISIYDAILLPTTATVIGRFLFKNSSYSTLRKTILGGLVYISVKCVIRNYQKYHSLMKKKTIKIADYPDTNILEDD